MTLHWTEDAAAMADLTFKSGGWTRYRWWKQLRKLCRKNRLCHGIWTKDGNRLIGLHMLLMQKPAMDVVSGILIGEKEFRGQRLGSEAKMAIVDHMFADCGAHRATSWVHARNFASLHMNVLCGFKQEAQMREQVRLPDGTWTDHIGFGMLRSEWEKLAINGRFAIENVKDQTA